MAQSPISSPESFHQILDALGVMVLVKGPQSRLLWANKAFCKFYGMSNEQLLGIIDAPFNEPDHTLQYVQDDARVFATGQILDIPQEPVTRFDGEVRIFHTVKSPIFDANGKVTMTVGISRDITEAVRSQKQLELERANILNAAKMATLGEMAGGIAHEINSPLATINLLAEQIKDLLQENDGDKKLITEKVERIGSTVNRIAKIVTGLKTFSRDGSRDAFANVALQQLIEGTLALSQERLMHEGIRVEVVGLDSSITLNCAGIQISQVLLNLLNNAHDAIVPMAGEKWIRIECREVDGKVEISVTDSGRGIPPDVREKLFRPFFTTKEIGKGTGLGLSISLGIIEAHGGTIAVDENCENTRFVIRLPKNH